MESSPSAAAPLPSFQKKEKSQRAFFARFSKVMFSDSDVMLLFASSKEVYCVFRSMLAPVRDAKIAYAATGVFFFYMLWYFIRGIASSFSIHKRGSYILRSLRR